MRNRAVSTVVSYVLVLGIVTLLTTMLFISMGGFVDGERQQTTRSTMEVVGNGIATDLDAADRLVQSTDRPGAVELTTEYPDRIVGTQYTIEIERVDSDGLYEITLRSGDLELSVTVPVKTKTAVDETTVDGGELEIVYDAERETLVVQNA